MGQIFCYIGNWGKHDPSIGYTICGFDKESGRLTAAGTAFPGLSVGANVVDEKRNILYCANESLDLDGLRHGGGGRVLAAAIDRETGMLSEINSRPTLAALTSFVDIDPMRQYLAAVNHGSRNYVTKSEKDAFGKYVLKVLHDDATVVLYPLNGDGSIGEICDIFYMDGSGPLPVQFASHLHSVRFAPDGSFFLVCDKGGDQIATFRIDRERHKIIPCMAEPFHAAAGSAPRYSAFHPQKPFVYTNSESRPLIYSFSWNPNGELKQTGVTTLKSVQKLEGIVNGQTDLRISADGRFLYSLMRGVNQIFVFEINQENGIPAQIQVFQMKAEGPRGCCFSPDGRFLLVAAMSSRQVVVYPVGKDGRLSEAVSALEQPTPCAVAFGQ